MSSRKECKIEAERRTWVERHERFKDLQEQYEQHLANVSDPDERRELKSRFAAARRAEREADIALGKRSPGMGVAMRQVMWARWLEIAVEHEMRARRSFQELLAQQNSDPLGREFHASLVAVTASAYSVEAVFGEIKYLLPPQPRRRSRHSELHHAFRLSFGISDCGDAKLATELAWIYSLRDAAVHPYTELIPTKRHPAGISTSVEHSLSTRSPAAVPSIRP